jgi:phospholipase/carboxylesterase
VAIGHGTHDPVIPVEFGREARRRLEQAGASVRYQESPMMHGVDPRFLRTLRGWLPGVVAGEARP